MQTLIKNGRIVTAADEFTGDLLIDGETIAALGANLNVENIKADRVINAAGNYVLPGGVDVHTHLDSPQGPTVSCDDFFTGQRAAAFGGTTTHVDFCTQGKGLSLKRSLDIWHAKANGKAVIDYGFHSTITDLTDAVMQEIATLPSLGVTSIKLFMAYKGALQVDDATMFKSMRVAANTGVLTLVHAENGDAIDVLTHEAIAAGNTSPPFHYLTRPAELETEATSRAIHLAAVANAPLFIVHLTNASTLDVVRRAQLRNQAVRAETCTHYLFLTKEKLHGTKRDPFLGAKYVCSPPLREAADQEALWQGLASGALSSVSTDHCPFNYAGQKELGREDFTKIPNGGPGIEDRQMMLWHFGVNAGRMSPSAFVALTATNPARLFGLYPKKGSLVVGGDADVVIWNPNKRHTLSARTHHMNIDYNMYEGTRVNGKPEKVFRRGELIVDGNAWLAEKGSGAFIQRGESELKTRRN